ncbi:molybdate ABC transporter permease subunit [Desulfomicrobium escambiense]|uniref:molybdate ABC transporter permease subunit n=1 Tax=Desulfomicrobium escambiense TaxID=29503 RepID=UPI00040B2490|nr:ABC transporter permease subunit [Desulfomicrobium escambiense]
MLESLTDPRTIGPLLLTMKVLAIAGGALLPCGVLLAWYLSGKPSPARTVVDFLVAVPLVFPPIATGFILLMLLGRQGPLAAVMPVDVVFAFPGLVLASMVSGLPLLVKPVEAALRTQGKRLSEVAAVLGKTPWQTFRLVLLPAVRRPVLAGWLLALCRSMGEVGVTLMLGGNIIGRTNTLSLEIYNCVFTGELDRAMALCAIIATVSGGMLFTLKRLSAI